MDQVRKTSPVDPKTIGVLAQGLELLGKGLYSLEHLWLKGAEVNQLYEEAAKKLPKDEEFSRNWFEQRILRADIDGARKVELSMYSF